MEHAGARASRADMSDTFQGGPGLLSISTGNLKPGLARRHARARRAGSRQGSRLRRPRRGAPPPCGAARAWAAKRIPRPCRSRVLPLVSTTCPTAAAALEPFPRVEESTLQRESKTRLLLLSTDLTKIGRSARCVTRDTRNMSGHDQGSSLARMVQCHLLLQLNGTISSLNGLLVNCLVSSAVNNYRVKSVDAYVPTHTSVP